jgi:hypothetical protein
VGGARAVGGGQRRDAVHSLLASGSAQASWQHSISTVAAHGRGDSSTQQWIAADGSIEFMGRRDGTKALRTDGMRGGSEQAPRTDRQRS